MDDLWKSIAELAATMHRDRIVSIADAIMHLRSVDEFESAHSAFGPNADQELVARLHESWAATPRVRPTEIAAALKGAAETGAIMDRRGAIELVWTGPKTGQIPTRRTEQVIIEVIDSAKSDVFLVTYVFYRASSIVAGLKAAIARGVDVCILLESSLMQGTSKADSASAMAEAVPGATIYVWDSTSKATGNGSLSASVHAKCVVADGRLAFITSANLTAAALERNMELGTLIRGGDVPRRLRDHLRALATTKVITRWSQASTA